jgi:hypothetical protein
MECGMVARVGTVGGVQVRQRQASHILVWTITAVFRLNDGVPKPLACGSRGADRRALEATHFHCGLAATQEGRGYIA